MKSIKLLIGILVLVLPACSLLSAVPDEVKHGQMSAYQGVNYAQKDMNALMDEVVTKLKAMSSYVHNYGWQVEKLAIEQKYPLESILWNTENEERLEIEKHNAKNRRKINEEVAKRTKVRDEKIAEDYAQIDEWAEQRRKLSNDNFRAIKQLLEAVYNWMSTSPLSVDNIANITGDAKKIWDKLQEE